MNHGTDWRKWTSQYQSSKQQVDGFSDQVKRALIASRMSGTKDASFSMGVGDRPGKKEQTSSVQQEQKLAITTDISKELGNTIQDLKKYHLRDCQRFLAEIGGVILTKKQKAVFELRAKGFTFDEIGGRLGTSRAAACKTNQICERKMEQYFTAKKVNKLQ